MLLPWKLSDLGLQTPRSSWIITASLLLLSSTSLSRAQSDAATTRSDNPSASARSTSAANGSGKSQPSVPLQPPPADFDVQGRAQEVLSHLNAVIRYYRSSLSPIQKVGEPSDALYRDEAITDAKQVAAYAFQAGKAEGTLLAAYQKQQAGALGQQPVEGEAQKTPDGEIQCGETHR